jgi:N4-(beta-N-acetylglucosaminyl)-L-asparaginase
MKKIKRREFMRTTGAAGLTLAAANSTVGGFPNIAQSGIKPLVIASSNGNSFKNGGNVTAVQKAFTMITQGADVLDAVIAGVNIVELDPLDDSVGYGGQPNADGVVQLDACCMHGPKKRAGGVAALEGVRTPSLVAKAVMENTDHHLLVGKGAQEFARNMGFKIEDDLNTDNSRRKWLEWKRQENLHGTINCNGINSQGEISGVTTTSGLSWKMPGRVGDSPILGAGLYVDGEVGAVGSTGRGEANLYGLCSFLIVEEMRRGRHPKDAGMEALRRIKANTYEKRLLKRDGNPNFYVRFYILNARGEYAGVAMYDLNDNGKKATFAICDENGPRDVPFDALMQGKHSE